MIVDKNDLNTIFASISTNNAIEINFNTGYQVGGYNDLKNIFASIDTNTDVEFTTTSRYNYFNFVLYGGGGNDRTPDSYSVVKFN